MMYTSALRQHELVGRLSPSPAASVFATLWLDGVQEATKVQVGVWRGQLTLVLRCLTSDVRINAAAW